LLQAGLLAWRQAPPRKWAFPDRAAGAGSAGSWCGRL